MDFKEQKRVTLSFIDRTLMAFFSRCRVLKRRIPVTLSHLWGWTLAKLSLSTPEYVNRDVLKDFLKKGKPAMFVANHNSWMDIPFTGLAVGWRNYKLVSKKELGIVPILGTAIRVGGNIMVDRLDRRSQIKTLKQGINYLKVCNIFWATLFGSKKLCYSVINDYFENFSDLRIPFCSFATVATERGREPLCIPRRNTVT